MQFSCIIKPKSKTDSIVLNGERSLRIKIKATPENGKANEYLEKYLSEIFRLPRKNIQIVSGFTSPHKKINIAAEDAYITNILSRLKTQT